MYNITNRVGKGSMNEEKNRKTKIIGLEALLTSRTFFSSKLTQFEKTEKLRIVEPNKLLIRCVNIGHLSADESLEDSTKFLVCILKLL